MDNQFAEAIWKNLRPLLDAFGRKLAAADPALTYTVGRSFNDAYLLRGYAGVSKSADGEEVAITFEAAIDNDLVVLSSDACMDSGEVLSEGPTTTVEFSEMTVASKGALAQWTQEFEDFLTNVEPAVRMRIAQFR